jgi:hypothetical protein
VLCRQLLQLLTQQDVILALVGVQQRHLRRRGGGTQTTYRYGQNRMQSTICSTRCSTANAVQLVLQLNNDTGQTPETLHERQGVSRWVWRATACCASPVCHPQGHL